MSCHMLSRLSLRFLLSLHPSPHPNPYPCVVISLSVPNPGDTYYLAIGGGVAEHNWNHIRTVLQDQGFTCTLVDHSEDMGMLSIQGPKRYRGGLHGDHISGQGGRGGVGVV
jgi:hypothetical protein